MAKKLEPSPCPYCGKSPKVKGGVWPCTNYWVTCGHRDNVNRHLVEGPPRKQRVDAIAAWNERKHR